MHSSALSELQCAFHCLPWGQLLGEVPKRGEGWGVGESGEKINSLFTVSSRPLSMVLNGNTCYLSDLNPTFDMPTSAVKWIIKAGQN